MHSTVVLKPCILDVFLLCILYIFNALKNFRSGSVPMLMLMSADAQRFKHLPVSLPLLKVMLLWINLSPCKCRYIWKIHCWFFASDLITFIKCAIHLLPISRQSLVDKAPLLYLLKDVNASVSRERFVFPCLETCTSFLLLPKM